MLAVNRWGFLDTEVKPGFEDGTVTNWVRMMNTFLFKKNVSTTILIP